VVAENVVVLEERVAQCSTQLRTDVDKAAVALPSSGVEQLLFLLLGQTLLRAAALFVFSVLLVAAPVGEALLQRRRNLGELREEIVAELFAERGAQVFIA
jgi:hypothetical protein